MLPNGIVHSVRFAAFTGGYVPHMTTTAAITNLRTALEAAHATGQLGPDSEGWLTFYFNEEDFSSLPWAEDGYEGVRSKTAAIGSADFGITVELKERD
jgi:hypothetical protein